MEINGGLVLQMLILLVSLTLSWLTETPSQDLSLNLKTTAIADLDKGLVLFVVLIVNPWGWRRTLTATVHLCKLRHVRVQRPMGELS